MKVMVLALGNISKYDKDQIKIECIVEG